MINATTNASIAASDLAAHAAVKADAQAAQTAVEYIADALKVAFSSSWGLYSDEITL